MKVISVIPNVISAIRLILAPIILVLLINDEHQNALLIFFVASASDLIDGYIARKYQVRTKLGTFLDPIADKLLIFLCVIYFIVTQHAPWWWLCVILLRDISLILGMLFLKSASITVEVFPTIIGKSATAFNMLAILALMAHTFKPLLIEPITEPLIIIATFITFCSFMQYSTKWVTLYKNRLS